MTRLVFLLCLVCVSAPAFAVYKCELNGKIMYSDAPCAAGANSHLPAAPSLATADSQAATQRASREKKALAQFEKTQRVDEQREQKAQRLRSNALAGKKKNCDALALQKKWREEDAVHTTQKSAEKAKRLARRAAEKYALVCKPA